MSRNQPQWSPDVAIQNLQSQPLYERQQIPLFFCSGQSENARALGLAHQSYHPTQLLTYCPNAHYLINDICDVFRGTLTQRTLSALGLSCFAQNRQVPTSAVVLVEPTSSIPNDSFLDGLTLFELLKTSLTEHVQRLIPVLIVHQDTHTKAYYRNTPDLGAPNRLYQCALNQGIMTLFTRTPTKDAAGFQNIVIPELRAKLLNLIYL